MTASIGPRQLTALMRPNSVAVIGASPDPVSYPGKVLKNLRHFGFPGSIHLVTPRHRTIDGLTCHASIEDVPGPVDVALILVGARNVPSALERAAAAGVKAAVVFSAGMAEIGAEGASLQAELSRIATDTGVRVLGPNCLGCLHVADNVVLSGAAALDRDGMIAGAIGVAAQSGGVMGSLLDRAWADGIGISCAFSTGNEADIDLADCIDAMVDDTSTRVIALFVETIRDIARFAAACKRAQAADKAVLALKIGRSERGSRVALTHTAAIAGDDHAYDALFRRLGVVRVNALDDLFLTANLIAHTPAPRGSRVAVACTSGGLASQAADLCADLGITLADPEPATMARIRELQAGFGDATNPLDITGHTVSQENRWMLRHIPELLLADPNVDLFVYGMPTSQLSDWVSQEIVALVAAAQKPVAIVWTGRVAIAGALARLREAEIPVFEQPEACFRAIDAAFRLQTFRARRLAAQAAPRHRLDHARQAEALRRLRAGGDALSERDSKALLALYGIAAPAEEVVGTAAAATAAAVRIGFPVAVKAHGASLRHKSDRDAVRLNLHDIDAVSAAFDAVTQSGGVAEALVAEMVPQGVELIVGLARDPQIGLMLIVGFGGIFVEVLSDVATVLPPLAPGEAEALLGGLRGAALLDGVRGRPRCDRAAIAAVIEAVAQFAWECGDAIEAIDINPLIAGPAGVVAVDALIIPRRERSNP